MGKMNQFKGVFSPKGETLAVAAAKSDVAKIYLINRDGSTIEIASKKGMNTDPDFSPAGDKIVFTSDQDGNEEIYLYEIKSKNLSRLTNYPRQDYSPSFSPDGSEIVFVSNMDDQYKWEIYKMSLKNLKPKRLTSNLYWDGFPRYSTDGKAITFSSKRNGSEDIYIMSSNGSGEKILYQTDADENDATLINDDLFFKANQSGDWEIYRYNLSTKKLIRLTNNKYPDWNPRVSRDANRLLIARKIKDRWQLMYTNLRNPLSAELIADKIREQLRTDN
jgi:TolB protein